MKRTRAVTGVLGVLLAVAGFVAMITWTMLPPEASAASNPPGPALAPAASGAKPREIRVYFPRHPETDDDMTAVFPVKRTAQDEGVARAALAALIAGPTPAEAEAGYFSELGSMLAGPSSCGSDDVSIRIENGTATVRFCRDVVSAGIGQDARTQSAIDATLQQFPTIQRVRLLSREGDCLFDMSGENRCRS